MSTNRRDDGARERASRPARATRRRVFGIGDVARSRARFADGGTIVATAGASVVTRDLASGSQRFLPSTVGARAVAAVSSHGTTGTIAVCAVLGDGSWAVTTHDSQTLKRKKTLTRDTKRHGGAAEARDGGVAFDGLAFSDDGERLLAYSTTSHALVCWNLSDGSSVELPSPRRTGASGSESSSTNAYDSTSQITHASFSPHENDVISALCVGGVFRTYRVTETIIKLVTVQPLNELVKDEGREAITHAWLQDEDELVAIGMSTGEVLVLRNDTIVSTVPVYRAGANEENALPETDGEHGCHILSVIAYKSGFIAAGDRGEVAFVDRVPRKQMKNGFGYRCVKRIAARENMEQPLCELGVLPSEAIAEGVNAEVNERAKYSPSSRVVGLDISPNFDNLLCTLSNKQVLMLSLVNADIMQASEMQFVSVLPDSHTGGVSSMDICRGRAIMISVSAVDKSIRLWNLASNSCEVSKEFLDSPLCVSVHPSGWIACVGFSDKLRLVHILNSDFRTVKEFSLKSCRVVEFSKGGHLFASAVGATIYVHHTFTHECVAVLRGHFGKVKALVWDSDDTMLISSGADGAIYEWDIRAASRDDEKARCREHVHKGSVYTSLAVIRHTGGIIACSSNAKITELDADFKVVREFSSDDIALTHVAYGASSHTLLAATSTGGVRAYKVPLTGEYTEYSAHDKAISAFKLSHNGLTLHTAGEDGCLFMFDIWDAENHASDSTTIRSSHMKDELTVQDDVLIARTDLDELKQRVIELQTQVKEVSLQAQYQLRLQATSMTEKFRLQAEEAALQLKNEQGRVSTLEREREDIVRQTKDALDRAIENHEKQLARAENDYTTKLFTEVCRYDELMKVFDAAKNEYKESTAKMISEYDGRLDKMKSEYAIKATALKDKIEALEKDRVLTRKNFERARKIMDEEVDAEIEQLKASYEAQIECEHDTCLSLRGENGVAKTKYALVKQHEEGRLQEIERLQVDKDRLSERVAELEKEANHLHETIDNHERGIEGKNELLADARMQMSKAEKHIAVLAKEAETLREQQKLFDERVRDRETEVESMNKELTRYYDSNSALLRQVQDIRSQRDALQREVLHTRKTHAQTATFIKMFQRDLCTSANNIQDSKLLKENVKMMYHKYTAADAAQESKDEAIETEERRQRDHLEKTVAALRRQLNSEIESRRVEFHRIMRENHALVQEMNGLAQQRSNLK